MQQALICALLPSVVAFMAFLWVEVLSQLMVMTVVFCAFCLNAFCRSFCIVLSQTLLQHFA